MKKIVLILTAALTLTAITGCSPKKETVMIKECIFPGDYPDPTIIRDGKDFYMTHSSFTYYPGLLVWHSTDLINWEPVARAVQGQDYSIFAPELCKVGDKYIIYYPTSNGENFVVTADKIEGPWSDPVKIAVSGIDPGHVIDTDGSRYLYTNNGFMVKLTEDGLAAAGRNRKVYDGWEFPAEWETEGMWLESPKFCKRGEYYYLISAEGGTAGPPTSHMCVVARSKSATGPWENSPYNPMVHTYSADEEWWSKGHGTLIDDADGNWYIVYHAYRNNYHTLGRSTIIESVVWTEDGWPVLANQNSAEWNNKGLNSNFDYLKDFSNPLMWAKWKPGFELGTLWTTTAVDESYEIVAEFKSEGADGGLYLFYNEDAYVGTTLNKPHFFIKIVNNKNIATVLVSENGTEWNEVVSKLDVSSYHHNTYQGFFALRPSIMVNDGVTVKDFKYVTK